MLSWFPPRGRTSSNIHDLEADPGETTNLAKNNPEVVARLRILAQSFVQTLGDEGKPGSEVRKAGYVKIAKPMNGKE